MRYTLVAVLLRDPMQDIRATIIVEVHVNIRHRDTVWIEETLEEEVVANRVNVRDAQAIGYGRSSSRSAPWAYEDAHIACRSDEVLHDEEVAWEAHP